MSDLIIEIGDAEFRAKFEKAKSPKTCAAFEAAMSFRENYTCQVEGRLFGSLGDREFGVGFEDATSHPAPGEIILYPGGVSETEILLAYGPHVSQVRQDSWREIIL